MSLYNALFGMNPQGKVLLALLGMTMDDVPRYRDCYLTEEHIVIHTRTGGGNREEYEVENDWLASHPLFVRTEDDDFDCTYANFYYRFPEEHAAELRQLAQDEPTLTPDQKWQALFAALDKMK